MKAPPALSGDSPAAVTVQKQTAVIGRGRACGKLVVELSRELVIDRNSPQSKSCLPCPLDNNCDSLIPISDGANLQK